MVDRPALAVAEDHLACANQVLALPTLTRRAATTLLHAHLSGAPIPTPATLARDEWRSLATWNASAYQVRIGTANLDEIAPTPAALLALREGCARSSHLLGVSSGARGGEVHALLVDGARPPDVLVAFVHATLVARELSNADVETRKALSKGGGLELARTTVGEAHRCAARFETALRDAGWDVESACHLEDAHSRIVYVSPDDPDCVTTGTAPVVEDGRPR